MPETPNPPALPEKHETPAGDSESGRREEQPVETPDRIYFFVAGTTEGPTGPVNPDVVVRRAERAMERLLATESSGRVAPAAARRHTRGAR